MTSLNPAPPQASPPHCRPRQKPNVLVLVADDHRHDAIRACGDPVVETPHLDRLIAAGTRFTRAHIMGGNDGAVCAPTRACLLTGVDIFRAVPDAWGDWDARTRLNPGRLALGRAFANAGYRTCGIGKWHNGRATFNTCFDDARGVFFGGMHPTHLDVPVNDYDPAGVYPVEREYTAGSFSSDFFADTTADYIANYDRPEPFFIYTAFTAPHDPRTPPAEFAGRYHAPDIPLPPNFLARHPFDNGALEGRDESLAPVPRTAARIREEIAGYYGMISHLDAGVGRILAALEKSGRARDTIVVYTADHGLAVGRHGLLGKQNLYEHSTRVPLILRGPGIPAGGQSDAPAYSFDLYATLGDLADVTMPDDLASRSLVPLLRGNHPTHREAIHAMYRNLQRSAQDETWKLIEYSVQGNRHTQLFNLREDPWELHNLATESSSAHIIERLRSSLTAWQARVGDQHFSW